MSRSKWPGNMSRGDQKFFQNGRFLETACGSVPKMEYHGNTVSWIGKLKLHFCSTWCRFSRVSFFLEMPLSLNSTVKRFFLPTRKSTHSHAFDHPCIEGEDSRFKTVIIICNVLLVTLAGRGKGGDCKEVQQATFSGGSALCTLAQFSFAGKSEKKKFCFSFPVCR